MQLRTTSNRGKTWHPSTVLANAPASYSDLVQPDRSTAGVLYETGVTSADEKPEFRRLPL